MLGLVSRNLRKTSQKIRQQAYFSLVRPHLEYCCSVRNPHTNKHISSYGQCLGHDSTSEMREPGEEKKCCKPPPHVQDKKQHRSSSHQCTPLHITHDCQQHTTVSPKEVAGYPIPHPALLELISPSESICVECTFEDHP